MTGTNAGAQRAPGLGERGLRTVRYRCANCDRTHLMKFAADYVAFRAWLMTCPLCRKYTLHRTVERKALTGTGWR